ncbi:hypothetical protein PLICRDRAFT_28423 [Plicaturopsis crispa FD-325 SS-3]|nr:hypothetical protein PLICRDRAFT_28423 [Plicaturopsis crispa FD-325 SS-3]
MSTASPAELQDMFNREIALLRQSLSVLCSTNPDFRGHPQILFKPLKHVQRAEMLLGHGRIGQVKLDVPIYLSETWMAYNKRIQWDKLADIVPDESCCKTHLTLPPPDLLTADEVDAMSVKGWKAGFQLQRPATEESLADVLEELAEHATEREMASTARILQKRAYIMGLVKDIEDLDKLLNEPELESDSRGRKRTREVAGSSRLDKGKGKEPDKIVVD